MGLPQYCATHTFKEFLEMMEEAKECTCTNPVHGGKLWKCNTEECEHYEEPDHPNTCRCEVCRFWS